MNWGILGCASIAVNSVIPAILRTENQNLISISSRSKEKGIYIANKYSCDLEIGYQNLINRTDINAVYIPLPNSMHYKWVKAALLTGKHVLVEKPAVTSFEQAQELVAIAQKNNLALVENFQFQTHSQNKWVTDKLKNNELGELRNFRSTFCFPKFGELDNIRYNRDLKGGALFDAGAYVLKAVSVILKGKLKVLSSNIIDNTDFDIDWYGDISGFDIKNNLPCQLTFGFDNYYQCNYEILGSKGKITVLRAFTAKADFKPSVIFERNGVTETIVLANDDHFKNMIQYFEKLVSKNDFEDEREEILNQALLMDEVRRLRFYPKKTKL